jgi:hypothetical protein
MRCRRRAEYMRSAVFLSCVFFWVKQQRAPLECCSGRSSFSFFFIFPALCSRLGSMPADSACFSQANRYYPIFQPRRTSIRAHSSLLGHLSSGLGSYGGLLSGWRAPNVLLSSCDPIVCAVDACCVVWSGSWVWLRFSASLAVVLQSFECESGYPGCVPSLLRNISFNGDSDWFSYAFICLWSSAP